jgi:hypothetical protein
VVSVEVKQRVEPAPETAELTESFSTSNNMLTAHYPADFAAKKIDDLTPVLS